MPCLMTQRRATKQRPQKVWDAARAAYLEGEPAASVARRFDVGYGNLRYRAHAEGWTRKAQMVAEAEREAEDAALLAGDGPPPPDSWKPGSAGLTAPNPVTVFDPDCPDPDRATPSEALEATVRRAARALALGHTREGLERLKAAEALAAITGASVPTLAAMDERDRDAAATVEAIGLATEYLARDLVERLFAPDPELPPGFEPFHLYWRQRQWRDPAPAAADRARVLASGRADLIALYDDEGVVQPAPAPDPAVLEAAVALLRARTLTQEYGGVREAMAGVVAAIRAAGAGEAAEKA